MADNRKASSHPQWERKANKPVQSRDRKQAREQKRSY